MKEPKFEIKPPEQKPEKQPGVDPALTNKSGVEVWEGEGGTVEGESANHREEKEDVSMGKEVPVGNWLDIMLRHIKEFPPTIQELIHKRKGG